MPSWSGSNPNPPSLHIGGSLSSTPAAPVVPLIPSPFASPSFVADLHHEDDNECELKDNRTFGDDEEEDEPELIADDSDDDDQSIPVPRRRPSSSGSHQYPEHFSSLDLEVITPTHEENEASDRFDGWGLGGCSNAE
ncbi:hypothetical protein PIB30_064227 [Stylosanthes scabra]|uniref:Uncharacterized protein n=1 Tax=Stylosanthes scabra TaxID=79078 RepID=A0ABU6ZKE3_9FABA|nr:hypothetical protein [Stylosanthes scabra]